MSGLERDHRGGLCARSAARLAIEADDDARIAELALRVETEVMDIAAGPMDRMIQIARRT